MIFLLDENFPISAREVLESMGHTAHDIRAMKLQGCHDSQIVSEAFRLGATILTTDRDFFHTLHHDHPDHFGIIVIALRQPNRSAILERLRWLLQSIPGSYFRRRAFQLRDQTWLANPPFRFEDKTNGPVEPDK